MGWNERGEDPLKEVNHRGGGGHLKTSDRVDDEGIEVYKIPS